MVLHSTWEVHWSSLMTAIDGWCSMSYMMFVVNLSLSVRYIFESVGGIRKLTINKCTLADDATYECMVGEEKCFTQVFIQGKLSLSPSSSSSTSIASSAHTLFVI